MVYFYKRETETTRSSSVGLSRFFVFLGVKPIKYFLFILFLVGISSNVFADSLVINYSNNKRLYKWDGTNIINSSNNKRLYKWDGTNIINYNNNKRLVKVDGLIPIPILIVLVVGLL